MAIESFKMGSPFAINIVNGLAGDPAVLAYIQQLGESVLFDAGSLETLSNKEVLKIHTVCISHTHVDHFIGFDRLIRAVIPHFRSIDVVGPVGIAQNVSAKLKSYTWNLLEPDQMLFKVYEVKPDHSVFVYHLSGNTQFELVSPILIQKPSLIDFAKIPLDHEKFEIKASVLDHGMPVCGFSLKMPDNQTVSVATLQDLGLSTGAWIGELQREVTSGLPLSPVTFSDGRTFTGKELSEKILTPRSGKKFVYLTDIAFSNANLERIKNAFSVCETLVCEANYRDEHSVRAFQKKHLTTKHAALIAASIKANQLKIFHVSNIYGQEFELSDKEAASFFETLRLLEPKALQDHVDSSFEK
jgi:ribonuclease Z